VAPLCPPGDRPALGRLLAPARTSRFGAIRPPRGHGHARADGAQADGPPSYLKASSTGTCSPVTMRLVWLAIPTTAISSTSCASVIPLARADAVCERMQYSQELATETAM